MPHRRDPEAYRQLAQQWRAEAQKLPAGETRDAYLEVANGYDRLAEVLDRNPGLPRSWSGEAGGRRGRLGSL
jgi:hypothetical protein